MTRYKIIFNFSSDEITQEVEADSLESALYSFNKGIDFHEFIGTDGKLYRVNMKNVNYIRVVEQVS